MFGKLYKWVDSRTGIQDSLEEALYENIPGGAKRRCRLGQYVGFCLYDTGHHRDIPVDEL